MRAASNLVNLRKIRKCGHGGHQRGNGRQLYNVSHVIENEILRYGYAFVFAGTVLEGDATLLTSSYLAHAGYLRMLVVFAIVVAATFLMNCIYFAAAVWKGKDWVDSYTKGSQRLARIQQGMAQHAGLLLIASRFMPGFRTIVPVLCGAAGMSPAKFALFNLAGAILWATSFGLAGFFGRQLLVFLAGDITRHEWLIASVIAIGTLMTWLFATKGKDWRDALETVRRS